MSAAYKGVPIGSLEFKTHRERLIRTEPVHELYGHLGGRQRGSDEDIAGVLRAGPAVRETIPLGSSVKRAATFPGWWERTNAMRITPPQSGVKYAVV
jgi:hypothetical protein